MTVKILFCTPAPLTKSLGAAKVVVELAEEMRELGWECDLVSIKDLAEASGQSMSESLRRYLLKHADQCDVVDYDHEYLPYARAEFSQHTLFVARSVLLAHHLKTTSIPRSKGIKSTLGALIKGGERRQKCKDMIYRAQVTVENADLVNVSNEDDKKELTGCGIMPGKIVVMPYGLSQRRRLLFEQISSTPPEQPVVAFVGTFDYRKGAREFPQIAQSILEQVPNTRFRFLGVKGLFQTEKEILTHFPKKLASKIDVVLNYMPEELPGLLASCSVGIFPSYMEGMPFGILEMMAASLPVIAYDAPGAPMLLSSEYLVPRGDAQAMSRRVSALLQTESHLRRARCRAKQKSQTFSWADIAQTTSNTYRDCIERKQNA